MKQELFQSLLSFDQSVLINILDNIDEIVVLQDTNNTILFSNLYASKKLNIKSKNINGRKCHEIWNNSKTCCDNCPVVSAIENKTPHIGNIKTFDGKEWEIKGIPIIDENNEVTGAIEIVKEVTEIYNLKKEKKTFKNIFNSAYHLIAILNNDFIITEASVKNFNSDDIEYTGKSIFDIFPKETHVKIEKELKAIKIESEPKEFDIIDKNTAKTIIIAPLPNNKISINIKNIENLVTEIRKFDDYMEKFDSFSSLLPMTIFETDSKLEFIYLNKFGHETWGYTKDDLNNGINIIDLLPEDELDFFYKSVEKSSKQQGLFSNQYLLKKKDGQIIPTIVYYTTKFTNNHFGGLRGVVIDITQQKKIEKDLISARKKAEEANRLKSAFLANISHEIRTPLNAIIGLLQIIHNDDIDEETYKNFVKIIDSRSKELLNTINNIIEISFIESEQISINKFSFDLYVFFNELKPYQEKLILSYNKDDIKLKYNIEEGITINSDKQKIKQVIELLFDNSLKNTQKGEICISAKQIENNFIEISVSDTGKGIKSKDLKKVFDLFTKGESFSANNYGLGLGLTITKKIVSLLGGQIELKSEEEKGTNVRILMPKN